MTAGYLHRTSLARGFAHHDRAGVRQRQRRRLAPDRDGDETVANLPHSAREPALLDARVMEVEQAGEHVQGGGEAGPRLLTAAEIVSGDTFREPAWAFDFEETRELPDPNRSSVAVVAMATSIVWCLRSPRSGRSAPSRAARSPPSMGLGARRAAGPRPDVAISEPIVIPAIGPGGSIYPVGKMDAHRRGLQHLAVSVFIFSGASLLQRFHWLLYVFGLFLVVTGARLLILRDSEVHPENP